MTKKKLNESLVTNESGWQCPVCGSGNAPWVSQCPCHQLIPSTPWPRPEWPNFPNFWPPKVID